jgi:hypothetical protein
MADSIQLGRLVTPNLSEVVSTTKSRAVRKPSISTEADEDMAETDSRLPLLGSTVKPGGPQEGLRNSGEYGTPGAKTSTDTIDRDANSDEDDDIPGETDDAHGGVQQADAINLVWSRNALILAYCL